MLSLIARLLAVPDYFMILVTNKKILVTWLSLVTLGAMATADKVWRADPPAKAKQEATIETLAKAVEKLDGTIQKTNEMLGEVKGDTGYMRGRLEEHLAAAPDVKRGKVDGKKHSATSGSAPAAN